MSYIDLNAWVKFWNSSIDNPQHLFFSEHISTTSPLLLDKIDYLWENKKKGQKFFSFSRFETRLLRKNLRSTSPNAPENKLLSIPDLKYVIHLKKQLSNVLLPKLSRRELMLVAKYLRSVIGFYDSDALFTIARPLMLNHIDMTKSTNDKLVAYLIQCILRYLSSKYSFKYLKSLPQQRFTFMFINVRRKLVEIERVLPKHKDTIDKLMSMEQKMLGLTRHRIQSIENAQGLQSFLHALLTNDMAWKERMSITVWRLRHILKNNTDLKRISKKEVIENGELSLKVLNSLNICITTLQDEILNFITKNVILALLFKGHQSQIKTLSRTDTFVFLYSLILNEQFYRKEYPDYSHDFRYEVANSCYLSFIDSLSRKLTSKIKSELTDNELNQLKDVIAASALEETDGIDSDYFTCFIERLTSKFQFKLKMIEHINFLTKRVFYTIITSIKSDNPRLGNYDYYNLVVEKLFDSISRGNYFHLVVPPRVTTKDTESLLQSLFDEILLESPWYRVFFFIGNLDCNKKVRQLGDAVLYDAREWDFGETYRFDSGTLLASSVTTQFKSDSVFYDNSGSNTARRNSCRAFVDVQTKDPQTAIDDAKTSITTSVDTLVFTSSSEKGASGFEPQFPMYYQVINKKDGSIYSTANFPQSNILSIDTKYANIMMHYNKLLRSHTNNFRDQLVRSISLFRNGMKEQSVISKFIFYWIAIEQLLMESNKSKRKMKDMFISFMPRIVFTWDRVDGSYTINRYLNDILQGVKNDRTLSTKLMQNHVLNNWEDNPHVLLEDLDYLKMICVNTPLHSSVIGLEAYLTIGKKKYLKRIVHTRREFERIKLAILYSQRNYLVHKGLTTAQTKYFATTLGELSFELIHKFLLFGQYCKTLTNLEYESNRPFQKWP